MVFLAKISLHDPPGNDFKPDDETKRTKMILDTQVIVRYTYVKSFNFPLFTAMHEIMRVRSRFSFPFEQLKKYNNMQMKAIYKTINKTTNYVNLQYTSRLA